MPLLLSLLCHPPGRASGSSASAAQRWRCGRPACAWPAQVTARRAAGPHCAALLPRRPWSACGLRCRMRWGKCRTWVSGRLLPASRSAVHTPRGNYQAPCPCLLIMMACRLDLPVRNGELHRRNLHTGGPGRGRRTGHRAADNGRQHSGCGPGPGGCRCAGSPGGCLQPCKYTPPASLPLMGPPPAPACLPPVLQPSWGQRGRCSTCRCQRSEGI